MFKILLVDDDLALHFLYGKMKLWEEEGFIISSKAQNGKEAYELILKNDYDVILTDIRMPVLDGIGLIKKLYNEKIKKYIIMLSSYDEFEYARKAIIYGASDFVVKPFDEDKMRKALKRAGKVLKETETKNILMENIENNLLKKGVCILQDGIVCKSLMYILDHISENMTMEDISLNMEYSKDYYGKLLKTQTGLSFKAFITVIKIEYGKYLLKNTSLKNYEISEKLGYSSVDYFTKIFKEETNMTPKIYKMSDN